MSKNSFLKIGSWYINLSLFVLLNCIYDYMSQITAKYELLLLVKTLYKIRCSYSNIGYK